ncbi:MAG: purine-nucleoside phosphorylase [Ezakiella sp.]|uniref:purine-nucleoside phosphorylase n=1 Tax=Ezakiella sp. TaxID=1935205 RepID=UPI002979170B|nr:purine-nucleoside phosphorylase [Ezakiella sp.]MDD7731283.1 purine-nucleoside phosphorylase [Eubacteriales bacterium]MDY6079222.1 purine-nucleoside phosphorylase [Ezakiella sp.]
MTPHNEAKRGDIKDTVLMPGDPLRAKYIAENFLTDVKQFNAVRNMFGYSGKYKGKELSVMGSGMGIPSIGIYAHELYEQYDVKNIIRVGSCGAYSKDLKLFDLVIAMGASSDSNFAHQFNLPGTISAICDFDLLRKAVTSAEKLDMNVRVGNVFSSDIFYNNNEDEWKRWEELGILAVEMECYGLYLTAQKLGKKALGILTVSDSFHLKEQTTPKEREKSFNDMILVALESCLI